MKLRLSLPPIGACETRECFEELALKSSHDIRKIVFYDELIEGYVVLDSSENHDQREKLIRLIVSVPLENTTSKSSDEYSIVKDNSGHTSGVHVLHETNLSASDVVLSNFECAGAFYTIWKFLFTLRYPSFKLETPLITISCYLESSAVSQESQLIHSPVDILPDFVPVSETNLLEDLNVDEQDELVFPVSKLKATGTSVKDSAPDPELTTNNVGLGILLPSDVLETEEQESVCTSIQVPMLVSLGLKLRSAKPTGKNTDLLTSVTIEASDELCNAIEKCGLNRSCHFRIVSLELLMRNGTVTRILAPGMSFPLTLAPNDTFTLTYRLRNNEAMMSTQYKQVNITLKSQLWRTVDNKDHPINGEITTEWAPHVDFGILPPPINNALKKYANAAHNIATAAPVSPRKSSMMTNARKQRIAQGGGYDSPRLLQSASYSTPSFSPHPKPAKQMPTIPSCSSVTVNLTSVNTSFISGLKLSFSGKFNILLGETVEWIVLATNTSNNILDATLVMSEHFEDPTHAALPHHSQTNVAIPDRPEAKRESAVHSRTQLVGAYQREKINYHGVIVLDNDLKLGPLEPRQVCERTVRVAGVNRGVYSLTGLKVIDSQHGSGVDFGKLIQVFVI